ncbi:hypothetical protein Q9S36_44320 [Microbacterium sp. ARD31]|uniref:hypothetical protein n=1 Tax=Microbacterium sp. ARD31 TaxID=2962576 RepID=UPI002881A17E|nr:hypothetical protein [Microbacterium sp. ARD31]MDT0187234.1 hypothetical protein [Microbacterium sp. ARD31]
MSNLGAEPTPEDIATVQNVLQLWNSGNQPAAVDALRPYAEEKRPWAVGLICWLSVQSGYPSVEQAIPHARTALELGMPWVATYLANNLMAHVASGPHLADLAMELFENSAPAPFGMDPVGQGWNLLSQGRPTEGLKLMGLTWQLPTSAAGWESFLTTARNKMAELDVLIVSAQHQHDQVQTTAASSIVEINQRKDELETSAKQAGLLVSATVSDATNALFKADADRNEGESKTAWKWGLTVLGVAAAIAVLPLILHYCGVGPEYSQAGLIGAHVASTAALATVAGVVLARARSRDLARQRANDLSTAMGTMISYSNQIHDPSEKQRFMMTMGQLVLQAHLTAGSGAHVKDESLTGLLALANIMRTPASGSTPSA